jgi:anaerobic ribonucleoside-triphosphate reductase activating protein
MLPFAGGTRRSLETVLEEVARSRAETGIEGITLLGGEPLAHAAGAAALARGVRPMDLSVMVFTGFTVDEARAMADPAVEELLNETDILVDGRYLRGEPDYIRRWIGSSNQRVHFLTERYRADDPRWRQPNTIELRLVNGEFVLNGFPRGAPQMKSALVANSRTRS